MTKMHPVPTRRCLTIRLFGYAKRVSQAAREELRATYLASLYHSFSPLGSSASGSSRPIGRRRDMNPIRLYDRAGS